MYLPGLPLSPQKHILSLNLQPDLAGTIGTTTGKKGVKLTLLAVALNDFRYQWLTEHMGII